jgi:CRP/FNR family transcriptional regulator
VSAATHGAAPARRVAAYTHGVDSVAGQAVSIIRLLESAANDRDRIRKRLTERFPVLAALTPEQLESVLDRSELRTAPAGAILFDAHQPCRGFPLLLEGSVRVVQTTSAGREILLYRVEPGQGCILSGSCLLGHSDYLARAVAEQDVVLLGVPPALFQTLLLQSEPFRRFVFGMYSRRLADVIELVEEVAFRRLDVRLAQYLSRRAPSFEDTHQRIADELGSVRESVSRLLRSFENRGWVRLERERITVLDPAALDTLAAERG